LFFLTQVDKLLNALRIKPYVSVKYALNWREPSFFKYLCILTFLNQNPLLELICWQIYRTLL